MARKTLVVLEDDLTGQELPDGEGETVAFSIDGTGYEIDLSHENSKVMRETFGLYVKHARRIGLGHVRRRVSTGKSDAAKIREWAVSKGLLAEGSRGRIPRQIADQYYGRSAVDKVKDDASKAEANVREVEFSGQARGK
jgi:hypothetical protein